MLKALRKRMTYVNVAMTLALVFAMTGGAFAAKKYLITSTKQISPSVLKSLAGKAGQAGAQGPAGPAGAAGKDGAPGKDGAQGAQGVEGKEGKQGPEGKAGKDGSPWTVGGTLPKGATETGVWTINKTKEEFVYAAISFSIPLAEALEQAEVHFINPSTKQEVFVNWEKEGEIEEFAQQACTGTAADPTATTGNLCVYAQKIPSSESVMFASDFVYEPTVELLFGALGSAGVSGARIEGFDYTGAQYEAWGSWAVTG